MMAKDLSKRIAFMMIGATLLFLITLVGSVLSIRNGLNQQAAVDSVRLVSGRVKAMQEELSATATDYSVWGDAYGRIMARDFDWIYSNFAITATTGELFDGLVLSRGTFPSAVAWQRNGSVNPTESFLPKSLAMQIEALVLTQYPTDNSTANFVALLNGVPSLVAASQVKPDDIIRRGGLDPAALPQAVFTRSVNRTDLEQIAADFTLTDLRFASQPVAGHQNIGLAGVAGNVVLYLNWVPPQPGSLMVDTMLPVLVIVVLAFGGLAMVGSVVVMSSASQLVQAEADATRLARKDSMTGLPNRLAFVEHLRDVEQAGIGEVGVLFMDINRFKKIIDTLGHDAGDAVVRDFAARMGDLADKFTLFARIGGDEFVFVVHDRAGVDGRIDRLSQEFTARLSEPFAIAGHSIQLSVSQGLAIKQHQDHTASELLRRADLAMYQAKRGGLGQLVSFSNVLDATTQTQSVIAQALRTALHQPQEFTMLYQPVFDPQTRAVQRVVALARWHSPELGPIDPGVFVPVAEATGQMAALGWLLLDRVGIDLGLWPGLKISFRISPRQLQLQNFVADLTARWALHGITPDRVEVSLPEPGIVDMADCVAHQLDLFHNAGFTTSLDCFGTGFSSISALRQIPFQTLKLDHTLIGPNPATDRSADLIGSMVNLGHAMGKLVVCKGLNRPDQTAAILPLGCDGIQGNDLMPPVPIMQFRDFYPVASIPATAA